MTVSSSTNKVSYSGNGTLTTFAYSFKIFDQDDLTVILRAADGTETTQTITTHYTVTGVGSASGGNVVFGTAPASGVTVVIIREQPLTQGLDLVPNDPFPAQSLEESLDKLTFMAQKHEEELSRAIKASRTNTLTGSEFTISASDRANKIFAFDSSGDLSVTQELGTFKGDWAASTAYVERDLVKDTTTNNVFIVNAAHTSSGSLPLTTNTNSSKYDKIIDVSNPAGDLTVGGNLSVSGTITLGSGAVISEAELEAIDDVTAGTVAASKAVIVDSNKDIASFRNLTATGAITGGSFVIGSADINENDLEAIDGVTAGTVAASKAVVVDVNKDISSFRNLSATGDITFGGLSDGSITVTAFVDEDNMASDSATLIPTQQSVKAYVDAQVATADALSEVLGNGNTTGGTDISVSTGDDITFADSSKAIFGAGSDLQIYHDGSNSFISDESTGNLVIRGSSEVSIQDPTGSRYSARFIDTDAVRLYHNGSQKLATTSTGIDVTGGVSIDDDNNFSFGDGTTYIQGSGANDRIKFIVTSEKMRLTSTGLGIGTTSPSALLQVEAADGTAGGAIKYTSSGVASGYMSADAAGLCLATDTAGITFRTGITGNDPTDTGSERMRIDSSGNLLHGKTVQSIGTVGVTLVNGQITATADGADAIRLNRKTSDGSIIDLRKDGTTVGSIGTSGGDLLIHTTTANHTGLRFGEGYIFPTDNTGATANGTVDLGISGASAFKSLYLAGTIGANSSTAFSSMDGRLMFDNDYSSSALGPNKVVLQAEGNWVGGLGISNNFLDIYTGGGIRFNKSASQTSYSAPMTLDASGNLLVATTNSAPATQNTDTGAVISNTGRIFVTTDAHHDLNRQSDGEIIRFRSAASQEGSISVSGSTVSYNGFSGRHESSGIPTTTARGTVVSTIDELDVYFSGPKEGQTRADHAKVEVSNSAGDACVYGVVDDFTDDGSVNVVSVGIASVLVTGACSKGDLLESNGDGTAKVQADDIIRSKTIGKVTIGDSNTGVKLVSCVMYCG